MTADEGLKPYVSQCARDYDLIRKLVDIEPYYLMHAGKLSHGGKIWSQLNLIKVIDTFHQK
jgi:hypothetical protein